ncbi:MAG: replicative DNA helicase [Bdellovibrionales bacterium]
MEKIPPHSLEAEQAVLGGLMLSPEAWDEVADLIADSDFFKPAHKKIFSTLRDLTKKGQSTDLIVVSNQLKTTNEINSVGGIPYLTEIIDNTPSITHIREYANIVKEKSLVRMMIKSTLDIAETGYTGAFEDVETFFEKAESEVFKLSNLKTPDSNLMASSDLVKLSLKRLEELYANQGAVTGVPTGFTELDEMLSGLQPGELSILAARPSMGKTALSLNIACHAAFVEKKSVAYFSVEMPKEILMMRILGIESGVNLSQIRTGRLDEKTWPAIINTAAKIADSNLYIDDTTGISPFEIRSKARKLMSKGGLDLIMIDYLQLMGMRQKFDSREREVAEISKGLKALAKELKIPVLALAQLNRGVEGRADRRPMLSDLRESGSIEQDADVIMMIFREDYYEKENPTGAAEVIVGKQRNGPTGTVPLRWDPHTGRFLNNSASNLGPEPPMQAYEEEDLDRAPKNWAPGS